MSHASTGRKSTGQNLKKIIKWGTVVSFGSIKAGHTLCGFSPTWLHIWATQLMLVGLNFLSLSVQRHTWEQGPIIATNQPANGRMTFWHVQNFGWLSHSWKRATSRFPNAQCLFTLSARWQTVRLRASWQHDADSCCTTRNFSEANVSYQVNSYKSS